MAQSKALQPFTRLVAAWQAGGQKGLAQGYPSAANGSVSPWWYIPAGYTDLSRVGDGRGNSAVEASLNVLGNSFAEAPPYVVERVEGQDQELTGHPLTQLLLQPNPHMIGELLWAFVLVATHVDGDAYLAKVRSAAGRVVELWPLMPDTIEPKDATGRFATVEERALAAQGMGPFIAYYEYTVDGRQHRMETTEVVHIKEGLNPDNPRKGKAPLRTVLREVGADEEAGQFAAAMLRNMGVPGVVLTPMESDDPGPTPTQADDIADAWEQRFGGRNRGRPLVMSGGRWQVERVSFSPQELDYTQLRRVPEERISAVLGVPAILAGLGAGLDRATYSNARELREFFTEQKLAPLWRRYGAEVTLQLGADFQLVAGQRVAFDTSDVRALQQDEDALFTRWLAAVQGGVATVADARRAMGLDTTPADDVYLRPVSQLEVPVGETTASAVAQAEAILARSEG